MMIVYSKHPRFEKQLKKLLKKYRTLEDDLLIAKKAVIELSHVNKIDNRSVELVPGFDHQEIQIFKIKKFACKALVGKGVRSGIRIVYAYFPEQNHVKYLEIYYKEKDNTDMDYDFVKNYVAEIMKRT